MLWIKNVIYTSNPGIEPVSGILLMNGIVGYEVCDSTEFNEFLENKEVYFDYIEDDLLKLKECKTTVTFYVPENSQGIETIIAVKNELKRLKSEDTENVFGRLEIDSDTKLEEQDWENNWKKYFKPFPVGEKLIIKPSWETLEKDDGRIVIQIDPSSSFGTGSHATTRLCLEKIEQTLSGGNLDGAKVLDMGCGSGILGIAALKLGAGHVTAVDIDHNSARIAAENYGFNEIDREKYEVIAGNVLEDEALYRKITDEKYDMVVANIVADVIMAMAPLFKKVLERSGVLIVSGIIAERSQEVIGALERSGFRVMELTEKEEWAVVTLCHASL